MPSSLLACPSCHALRHAADLKQLAAEAEQADAAGRLDDALTRWRSAAELLPPGAPQAAIVTQRITSLVERLPTSAAAPPAPKKSPWALASAAALLVWKLKWVVAFVATKGKIALLGVTKVSTLLSMLATVGLYWGLFGWPLAVGFVVSIYLHEIGHVAALRRLGIQADAPMFIPGIGAFVRLKQRPQTPREDAIVGLAGPIWGLGVAAVCAAVFFITDVALFAALARLGAWINLFNLLPIGSLDGGRGFSALSTPMRIALVAATGALTLATGDGLLMLLTIAGIARLLIRTAPAPQPGDRRAFVTFLLLLAGLAALTHIEVPGTPADQSDAPPVVPPVLLAPTG